MRARVKDEKGRMGKERVGGAEWSPGRRGGGFLKKVTDAATEGEKKERGEKEGEKKGDRWEKRGEVKGGEY